jgi:hypothetical protein
MKWMFLVGVLASGCGGHSDAAAMMLVGSYNCMVTSDSKPMLTDKVVMTVQEGSGVDLLLTFAAGITTDPMGPNPGGLRTALHGSSMITIDSQACHIDTATGPSDGNISGMGTIMPDGSAVDIMLSYAPTNIGGVAMINYEITGSRQ